MILFFLFFVSMILFNSVSEKFTGEFFFSSKSSQARLVYRSAKKSKSNRAIHQCRAIGNTSVLFLITLRKWGTFLSNIQHNFLIYIPFRLVPCLIDMCIKRRFNEKFVPKFFFNMESYTINEKGR